MSLYLDRLRSPHSPARTAALSIVAPALVTLLAPLREHVPPATAAVLYVLAVVVAAAAGGAWAGIGASALSFLALNFFFTSPVHTLAVRSWPDLVALVVFLVVAVIVGLLLSTALAEKRLAERREKEARLLNQVATRLLSGEDTDKVLQRLADGLVNMTDAARCEIETVFTRAIVVAETDEAAGQPFEVPITTRGEPIGTLRIARRASARFDEEERALFQALAPQLALVLESTRLHDEVRRAQLDAEASRLRAVLFSGVTHDLKTPLAAITASVTSLLDDTGFTDRQRHDHLEIGRAHV